MNAGEREDNVTDSAVSLRVALGTRVRHLREGSGRSQDDLARVARAFGLAWDRSKVAALERGQKSVSLEELVALVGVCRVLTTDETLSAGSLLAAPEPIVLHESIPHFSPADIQSLLVGTPEPTLQHRIATLAYVMMAEAAHTPGKDVATYDQLMAAYQASGEAEEKAARKLSIPRFALVAASVVLFGQSLTEEREARVQAAGADQGQSLRAQRGHVTRELLSEIEVLIQRLFLPSRYQFIAWSPSEAQLREALAADELLDAWRTLMTLPVTVLTLGAHRHDDLASPAYPWQYQVIEGSPHVVVYTSPLREIDHIRRLRLLELVSGQRSPQEIINRFRSTAVPLIDVIKAWPDQRLSLAINPSSEIGISMSGAAVGATATVLIAPKDGGKLLASLSDAIQSGMRWLPEEIDIAPASEAADWPPVHPPTPAQ